MTKQQVHTIRTAEVSVLGSVYDGEEAARVVRMLRYATEDSRDRWNGIGLSPDVAVVFGEGRWWSEEAKVEEVKEDERGRNYYSSSFNGGSGLRELSLTVTARDVVAPMADSAAGMAKMLELETSPFFVELAQGVADGKFQRLRRVNVNVELGPSLKGAYLKEDIWEWEHDLWSKLNLVSKHSATAGNSDGKGGQNDDALQARMGVKVQATFNPSPLTPAAEYVTTLGGDESWWTGNTSATGGWGGSSDNELECACWEAFVTSLDVTNPTCIVIRRTSRRRARE